MRKLSEIYGDICTHIKPDFPLVRCSSARTPKQIIQEVEGIVGLSNKPGADIAELIGKKSWGKGMKVTIAEGNELHVDCNLIVAYGQSVVAVAKAAQEAISAALESMTGVKVGSVNVNICGISAQ